MTKERLEELIKQRATIWSSGFDEEIKLNPKNCKIEKQKWLTESEPKLYLVIKEDEEHYPTYCLDNLREDVDRAKWEHNMYAERTERFEPPMWEDIERYYGFSFYGEIIDKLYHRAEYRFFVDKSGAITIFNIAVVSPFRDIYSAYATKENYEKACEIVRGLFKGEKWEKH